MTISSRPRDAVMKELRSALDEVYEQRARVNAAERALVEAVENAANSMRHASHYFAADGEKLPVTLIREIYWKMLDLPVEAIALAFRVHTNAVYAIVGTFTVERPCVGCGNEIVSKTARSRSELRAPRETLADGTGQAVVSLTGRQVWTCEGCRAGFIERAKANRAEWLREQREQQERDARLIAEAEAAGTVQESIVRWAPGVGTYSMESIRKAT